MNKEEQIKELKKAHAKILRQIKAFSKATGEYEAMASNIMGVDVDIMWSTDINNDFILTALWLANLRVCETEHLGGSQLGLEDLIEKLESKK